MNSSGRQLLNIEFRYVKYCNQNISYKVGITNLSCNLLVESCCNSSKHL